jgi:hypothetical protein
MVQRTSQADGYTRGAFNALLTDEDSSDDEDDCPAMPPPASPTLPGQLFFILSPPAKALPVFRRQVSLSCPPLPLYPLTLTPNPPQEGDGGGGRERPGWGGGT